MAIEYSADVVRFCDVVGVEEAEAVLGWLQAHPDSSVDLTDCTHLHPANLQVLMACTVKVRAWPSDPTLTAWLTSALSAQQPILDISNGDPGTWAKQF